MSDSDLPDDDAADDATDEEEDGGGGLAAMLGGAAGGGLDLSSIFDQAMALQSELAEKQAALAEAVVEGQAGGGAVTVVVTGGYEFRKITIRPDAVDPDDVEMLEDLVLAALHEASRAVNELQAGAMGGLDVSGLLGGD